MAGSEEKSFAGQIQLLMQTQPDFPQRFKKRIIFESSKVANPFKFISGLISKGVFCDGSDESEASFGLKETIVQLVLMLACSKDVSAVGGLMESLEESGNSDLVSSLRTWMKEDFGVEINGSFGEPKGNDSNVPNPTSKTVAKPMKNSNELRSSGTRLIDKIMSRLEDDFIEQLEGHLIGKASKIVNVQDFYSSLANEKVLDVVDVQLTTGPEVHDGQLTENAIKAACSKRAVGSLILALQSSNNEHIIAETYEWLESPQARKKNYPIAVKSLASQRNQEESKAVGSTFFEQPALPDGMSKLATFKCQEKCATKGTIGVQFDKEKMIVCAADGTLNVWNWRDNKEESIQIAKDINAKNITCFQYDEDILVLGTSSGTVHLFDARTFQEKSTIHLSDQVTSLKFVESTLVVLTREDDDDDQCWWVDISRPDMQFCKYRDLNSWRGPKDQIPGVCMYPDISFVFYKDFVFVYDTKLGDLMRDENGVRSFRAPYDISTLSAGDLFSAKRVLVAGCTDGSIGIWNTPKLMRNRYPVNTLRGHQGAIVSLCIVKGHLLSLDKTGKLLMWFGYDLESLVVGAPIPLVLGENFSNVSNLAACERWFATGSSEDGTVNIYTLPDLWLRAL